MEQSRVTDTEIKLVCVVCSTQADSTVMWPCLSLSLSLSLSHSHTQRITLHCAVMWPCLSPSLTHTTHTHNALLYTALWCDHVSLSLSHTHDTQNSAFEQSTISFVTLQEKGKLEIASYNPFKCHGGRQYRYIATPLAGSNSLKLEIGLWRWGHFPTG